MTDNPLVSMCLMIDELLIAELGEISGRNATEGVPYSDFLAIRDLENPSASFVALFFFGVVAFAGVGPIGDIDGAIGAVFGVESAEPGVFGERKIGRMLGDVAAAVPIQPVANQSLAVDVEQEGVAAVFGGPVVAKVDHAAAVGVPAAEFVVGLAAAGS